MINMQNSSIAKQDILLKKLQGYREDDLTNEILIPLFKTIGYADVHFNGGVYEKGKDIILMKLDSFDEIEISVAQVKMFNSTRSTKNRLDFDQFIYQLRQCHETEIKYKDGKIYFPKDVFFISPYVLETRLIEEQFSSIGAVGKKVRVIDGAKLYSIMEEKCPQLLEELLGINKSLSTISQKQDFSNIELISALNINSNLDYSEYYSDLNFFMGSISSNILYDCKIRIDSKTISISNEDWSDVKSILIKSQNILGNNILTKEIDKIEFEHNQEYKKFISDENTYNIKELESICSKYKSYLEKTINQTENIKNSITSIKDNKGLLKNNNEELLNELHTICNKVNKTIKNLTITSSKENEIYTLWKELNDTKHLESIFKNEIENLLDYIERIISLSKEHNNTEKLIIKRPSYTISFRKENELWFNSEIQWYKESAKKINKKNYSNIDLRAFIDRIQKLLGLIDDLTNRNKITASRISFFSENDNDLIKDRLEISAHSIFDSGCNVALYGEAGAGKTTTLQVYAQKYELNKTEHEFVIYIPLNRLANKFLNFKDLILPEMMNEFDTLLVALLIYRDLYISIESLNEFKKFLESKKKLVFILDGLDEAHKIIPWILKAISLAHIQFNYMQIIASTRDCVTYLTEIEFIGITLLPFNEEQLIKFIKGWLKNTEISDKLISEIENQNLFEVAKNPLLATIICNLAQQGIDIPKNEPQVYRKKISLLCGSYDRSKKIQRVFTQEDILEEASRKIAFHFHNKNIREIDYKDLEFFFINSFTEKMTKEAALLALTELINPCNILKKDPFSNFYGFGHLRYQEYLSAEELIRNRGIDVVQFLHKDWWRGVLYLYAFSCKIDSLFEECYDKKGRIDNCVNTFKMMISARPAYERKGLNELLKMYQGNYYD